MLISSLYQSWDESTSLEHVFVSLESIFVSNSPEIQLISRLWAQRIYIYCIFKYVTRAVCSDQFCLLLMELQFFFKNVKIAEINVNKRNISISNKINGN